MPRSQRWESKDDVTDDIETLKLERIVQQFEQRISQRSLLELERLHGRNSPEVAKLLLEIIEKLQTQPGNEAFVEDLQLRVKRIKNLWKNCKVDDR